MAVDAAAGPALATPPQEGGNGKVREVVAFSGVNSTDNTE